jgi:hypothetical protein
VRGIHTKQITLRYLIVCAVILPILVKELGAQQCQTGDCSRRMDSLLSSEPERTVLESITGWILPEYVNGWLSMKDFIRGDGFQTFRLDSGDLKAVNLIFLKGVRIAGGDIDLALFICFIGTMDHAQFGIRVPLIGGILTLPLTTESDQNFHKRHHHLPSHFYPDSPSGAYGDRDKLQHFFGSAYIAYASGSGSFTNVLSSWIEILEQKYVVEGTDDPRDRRANRQGTSFGKMLFDGKDILPGDVLVGPDHDKKVPPQILSPGDKQ